MSNSEFYCRALSGACLTVPTRFLSTVQIGITLIGILAGAFGGATIAGLVAVRFIENGLASAVAPTIALLSRIAYPIVTFLLSQTHGVRAAFAANRASRRNVARTLASVSTAR
jgi:putative hemolysin